jgi:hypothetical protein
LKSAALLVASVKARASTLSRTGIVDVVSSYASRTFAAFACANCGLGSCCSVGLRPEAPVAEAVECVFLLRPAIFSFMTILLKAASVSAEHPGGCGGVFVAMQYDEMHREATTRIYFESSGLVRASLVSATAAAHSRRQVRPSLSSVNRTSKNRRLPNLISKA